MTLQEDDHAVEIASLLFPLRPDARTQRESKTAYFLPLFFSCVSFSTFLTIFCSSMRKARTIRSRTQLAHLEPPYARDTDFWVLDMVAYSLGRRAGSYTHISRQQNCSHSFLRDNAASSPRAGHSSSIDVHLEVLCRSHRISEQFLSSWCAGI